MDNKGKQSENLQRGLKAGQANYSDFILYYQNVKIFPCSQKCFDVRMIHAVTNSVVQIRRAIKFVDNQTYGGNSFSHVALTSKSKLSKSGIKRSLNSKF